MRLLSGTPLLAMALLFAAVATAPKSVALPNDHAVMTVSAPEMIAPALVIQDSAAVSFVVADVTTPAIASSVVALPVGALARSEPRPLHGGPSPLGRMTRAPNLLDAARGARERPPAS